ncbi:hypothetical protein GPECTOR_90g539 [Gonium pectorale]|uniref:RING-type E3 ubiquitin transferase n=1 Tax=Gonium pectorale TaxID=33097 RepID=A0A150G0S4_GONPE|nr:hypothetical protein GPECTOR_90g539 [Gonium pectorale]|eukprot:KXZ43452.1 hypothetical protein GPECTOR_90g539 [Gonium pectorale]
MGFTLTRYLALSVLAASAVVYHAFATRQYFYRSTMYLSSSKVAVAAMGNLAFALALCTHKLVIKIFLGSLRDIEQEMIRERLSSAVMESLLALTIFREEFSTFFVAMFASLVFIKVMHWLVQDRVDYVEVTPTISLLGHARIVSFMILLLLLDAAFLQYTIAGTIQYGGQSVLLLFAFEYVILASTIVRYALKYGMSMADLAMDGNWAGKGAAVFYLELISDLLHLFVYTTFFAIVFMHYGLPLHLVRDLYHTYRNFRSRMHDFLRFRQVTARLDRFPDATPEDLRRCDGVCIICREEMAEAAANKRLFCGHVFHLHCLRSWLERQQNCPTCRASVFRRPPQQQQPAAPAQAPADVAAARDPVPEQPFVARGDRIPEAVAAAAGGMLRHRHVTGPERAAMRQEEQLLLQRLALLRHDRQPPGAASGAHQAAAAATSTPGAAPADAALKAAARSIRQLRSRIRAKEDEVAVRFMRSMAAAGGLDEQPAEAAAAAYAPVRPGASPAPGGAAGGGPFMFPWAPPAPTAAPMPCFGAGPMMGPMPLPGLIPMLVPVPLSQLMLGGALPGVGVADAALFSGAGGFAAPPIQQQEHQHAAAVAAVAAAAAAASLVVSSGFTFAVPAPPPPQHHVEGDAPPPTGLRAASPGAPVAAPEGCSSGAAEVAASSTSEAQLADQAAPGREADSVVQTADRSEAATDGEASEQQHCEVADKPMPTAASPPPVTGEHAEDKGDSTTVGGPEDDDPQEALRRARLQRFGQQ